MKAEECTLREPILISWVTALGSTLQRAKMGGLQEIRQAQSVMGKLPVRIPSILVYCVWQLAYML